MRPIYEAELTFEVSVVEWDTDTIETKALEERGVRILEEVFQELHTVHENSERR